MWNLLMLLALSASAVEAKTPKTITTSFNPSEVAWSAQTGSNSIEGSAVLRTVGGGIRTCAGTSASLVPVSTHAVERMTLVYGNATQGYSPRRFATKLPPPPSGYATAIRTSACDAFGNFHFGGLPDGDYFVIANVSWGVHTRYFTRWEGGNLMQRMRIAGGEVKRIVLTAH